ncbi:MAG: fibronectin type III domain-containing protein [Acidobacteriota bacterium]
MRRSSAVLTLFALLALTSALEGAIPASERQALIAFYNATGGDSWGTNSGWKTPPLDADGFAMPGTENTWYGVTVGASNTTVTGISLPTNNLIGSLPAAIGDLTNLTVLNFRHNELSGSLPSSVGNLVNLTTLQLSENQLSGSLPAELGNLTQLTTLNLYYNQFSGSLPSSLGGLTGLQTMSLYSNLFDGAIPSELGSLTGLTTLDLHDNRLSGSLPASLGNLTALRDLLLQTNALTGSIPTEWGNMTALQKLYIQYNQLSGSIPASLGSLADLQEFVAGNNQLSGSIPSELGDLHSLIMLDLRFNSLTGSIPAALSGLTSVRTLLLQFNDLSGTIPPEFGNLAALTDLRMQSNSLTGPIPVELGNLANLVTLYIHLNQLSGPIPAVLGNLTKLAYLHLYSNQLTGSIPAELGSLTNLIDLSVNGNHLAGTVPAELGSLTKLQAFRISSNMLAGPLPASLMNLTALVPATTDLSFNALYTSDSSLAAFLDSKDSDWASLQTVAPSGVTAATQAGGNILVSWTPIAFTTYGGYYDVLVSQASGGPYASAGHTVDKKAAFLQVTGLTPGQRYYFVVRTHTDANAGNSNAVDSGESAEVSAVASINTVVSISGTVLAEGLPLAGVTLSGLPGSPVTNEAGAYGVSVDAGWSGVVTPVLEGYSFEPASRTYADLTSDKTGQDYAAAEVVPAGITVIAPNGGETWKAGSTQAVTWAETGLADTVTIDLYEGGVYQKTLGTADVTAGTFSWKIASDETVATNCRVLVWQGGVSDDSDADFAIEAAAVRKDDLVVTWDATGLYYRDSDTGGWVRMASPANMVRAGDLDGDGIDDVIGIWPSQGGVWVKYSATGAWTRLSSTAAYIGAGDMNGDGRVDLVGSWDGQGVFYRNSVTGAWVKMASPATMVTAGDIDGDGTDDLIGLWPAQGGIWVKYSKTCTWARLSSTAVHIAAGDMNGDGRVDLLGTWDGQGVFYRDSITGAWVKMASPATLITAGDIDRDRADDLMGVWPSQGGVWAKSSSTAAWQLLGATARDIAAGKMRPVAEAGDEGGAAAAASVRTGVQETEELSWPVGGAAEGPGAAAVRKDLAADGPGGARFVHIEDINLEPREALGAGASRPGPGEPGFACTEQKNAFPGETRTADRKKENPRRSQK